MVSKFHNAKRLSLEFFYKHSFTIGVCAFIASLVFSCSFTLQFAPEIPEGSFLSRTISPAIWTRLALFLSGFSLMGGQIITFVMYKKAKKNWVFGLYCGLTLLSIFATFGSFATGLEERRINAGQSDSGLQALIDQKNILKEAIKLQDEDTIDSRKRSRISAGVDKIRPARQKNVEELGRINREILEYSKDGNIGEDSITKMFLRVASVIQIFSFGKMSDETRDVVAMLLECLSFVLIAVFIDLVAAFCAAISVRVDNDDFQQVLNDEAMEQSRESAAVIMRKESKLTHDERMKNVKAHTPSVSPASSPAPSTSYNTYIPQSQTYDFEAERMKRRPENDMTDQLETIHVDTVDTNINHVNTAPDLSISIPEINVAESQILNDEKNTQRKSLPGGAKNWDSVPVSIPESDNHESQKSGVKNPSFRRGRKSQKTTNRITEYSHELLPGYIKALFDPPKPSGSLQGIQRTGNRLNFVRRVSELCHKELLKIGLTKLKNKNGRQYTYPQVSMIEMLQKVKEIYGVE